MLQMLLLQKNDALHKLASVNRCALLIPVDLLYATLTYDDPVVIIVYKEDTELGFPEIRQLITECERLSGGKPYVTLSDVRIPVSITEQGKRYVANPDNMKLFRGTAVVVKNKMFSIAANFMNYFNHQPYPFKAFTNTAEALKWLKTLPLK